MSGVGISQVGSGSEEGVRGEPRSAGLVRACILGTAGHIDHGKSSLVKALSGTDPDRLPEEQARGMTIELGFAQMVRDHEVVYTSEKSLQPPWPVGLGPTRPEVAESDD